MSGLHQNAREAAADALAKTTQLQGAAADPQASVWVSANAGTGKTHVLTNRVLRLMLAGSPPEKILCLTYTKAAAAEMSTRVFNKLASFVTASEDTLSNELEKLLGRAADDAERQLARQLFTRAIETPGGLKVQTIHAFCERLLQRFPLEAGVAPGFQILDDTLKAKLMREAVDEVLDRAAGDQDGALAKALATAIAYAQEDQFDAVINGALARQAWLDTVLRLGETGRVEDVAQDREAAIGAFARLLRQRFGLSDADSVDGLTERLADVIRKDEVCTAVTHLRDGSTTDIGLSKKLDAALSVWPYREARIAALRPAFITSTKPPEARKSMATKAVAEAAPDVKKSLEDARDRFFDLDKKLTAARLLEATLALVRLADAVMAGYVARKTRRAVLDYDDLIIKTGALLASSESASWVLYKLDGGLDHILVDESQDTAPAQWAIIEALASEFFDGEGAREEVRTLFAVGDEKQSIYSFQGAAPEMFARMGARFKEIAQQAGRQWRPVPLELSFRTVSVVLEAVDRTFADPATTPGLGARDEKPIKHLVKRVGQAGLVEVWPTEKAEGGDGADPWAPFDDQGSDAPALRLANRIADTIGGWLDAKEMLPSLGRPIRPRDVLILVRKRTQFAVPMVSALKARGIPVAGSDRMDLVAQIAVKDLIALADFLVLPEDDLALANVLKSPLFGYDDDALFNIAYARKGTLWRSLLANRALNDRFASTVAQLIAWRKRADFLPPFEFFSEVLDRDGGRRLFLDRLGLEAADPLDEFLNAAIQFDEDEPPSLQGFVTWLRSGSRQIKRDMEQGSDEVRVLTVHGAKGLEAPIVFLPDTCSTKSGGPGASGALVEMAAGEGAPSGLDEITVWATKGTTGLAPIKAANDLAGRKEAEERNRLLYVAMTRARDRLYVCGFEGKGGRQKGCWYDLISDALGEDCAVVPRADGGEIRRIETAQDAEIETEKTSGEADLGHADQLPDWALRPAPALPAVMVPIAPSRLAPYDYDSEGEPTPVSEEALARARLSDPPAGIASLLADASQGAAEPGTQAAGQEPSMPPAGQPETTSEDTRFLRGTLTHALLQYLPDIAPEVRHEAATAYLASAGAALAPAKRQAIVAECLAILSDERFGWLFGPGSRAEASISALIPHPDGAKPPLAINGQIDRLCVSPDEVAVVDFKSNRIAPNEAGGLRVPEVYLLQLAAYRQALAEIYPDRPVRAYLLWTALPALVEVPQDELTEAASKLWDLKSLDLDGQTPHT